MRRLGMNPRPLMTWAMAPSAPQRCSPELLEGLAALSHEHNLPVFTHVYETRPQAAAARVQSSSLLDMLANRAGLMNERLNLVHGVWLASSDIAMLAESGARVVHNPISNLKLKSGVAPILDLYRCRRSDRARLRQLQLRRDPEHLRRDANAVPAAGRH